MGMLLMHPFRYTTSLSADFFRHNLRYGELSRELSMCTQMHLLSVTHNSKDVTDGMLALLFHMHVAARGQKAHWLCFAIGRPDCSRR